MDRSAKGIAQSVAAQINSGELPPGSRLPTVRALALELGVSTTTVAQAWGLLGRAGLVSARGKAGTTVTRPGPLRPASRYSALDSAVQAPHDLSLGVPDPALLPDVRRSMRRVTRTAASGSYHQPTMLPELTELMQGAWPFEPGAMTVVNGAVDGMARVIAATVSFGAVVAVENPTFPPILDLLDERGARLVPLDVDDEGVVPASLSAALAQQPVLVVLQPRAHNPCGHSMTASRAEALAAVLADRGGGVILEDDHAGYVASAPAVSLGTWLPDRTVLVRSFSKSHGPDLRLAALGGADQVVRNVVDRRFLGPGWSSHLLQALVCDMLTDVVAVGAVERARATYRRRGRQLTDALAARGLELPVPDGLNMWVPVRDEHAALTSLGLAGIAVAPGAPFETVPLHQRHVRLTYAQLTDRDIEPVADAVSAAALVATRRLSR